MFIYQGQRMGNTLAKEIAIEGIGLMSGQLNRLKIMPEHQQAGYHLRVQGESEWTKLDESRVVNASARTTVIGTQSHSVVLVEHLLSALKGMGVDHVRLEVEGNEIPGLDGSAKLFAEAIQKAKLCSTELPVSTYRLQEPFSFEFGESLYALSLGSSMSWHCVVDYPQTPSIGFQSFDFCDKDDYLKSVSPARTFCLEKELEMLRQMNLIKGASLESGVVFQEQGILNPEGLRFSNEPARHKLLDMIGDLSLLGVDIQAHLVAVKPSHHGNNELAKIIRTKLI